MCYHLIFLLIFNIYLQSYRFKTWTELNLENTMVPFLPYLPFSTFVKSKAPQSIIVDRSSVWKHYTLLFQFFTPEILYPDERELFLMLFFLSRSSKFRIPPKMCDVYRYYSERVTDSMDIESDLILMWVVSIYNRWTAPDTLSLKGWLEVDIYDNTSVWYNHISWTIKVCKCTFMLDSPLLDITIYFGLS